MEIKKHIADILDGNVRVLAFDDVVVGPEQGITPCSLCALNFVRLAFATEASSAVLSKILTSLSSRKAIENAIAICGEWRNDGADLDVEDVYCIPLFEGSLKHMSTDHSSPSIEHVTTLLEHLRTLASSAAIIIAHHLDIIACVRLRTTAQEVFVLFNPRASPEHERAASVTFSTSLAQIVQRLCDLFPVDKVGLLERCAVHVFVPRATAYDSRIGEDSLLVSSLTLLMMKAELEELTRNNENLKKEKQRMEKSIIDLGTQLGRERVKNKRVPLPQPPPATTSTVRSTPIARGSVWTRPSHPTRNYANRRESEDEIDPSIQYALQLQATFDSENEFLLKQKQELMQTAQRQYHCGVCLDDFPEDDAVRIDACGHEICRGCAHGHVSSKIEEHRFPVLCPVCMADSKNRNPGTIPGSLVQLLGVSEKQWEIWVEMELAQFSIPFTCRKCQHSAFVDRQDIEANPEIHCPFPACEHVWCKKCQQTIEPNGPKHSCDGTSELDHLVKQQGWRYCPNCKTPIQKSMGCNHLSCIAPGCNTHFCYGCGQTINRTAIPQEIQQGKTEHFRRCAIV